MTTDPPETPAEPNKPRKPKKPPTGIAPSMTRATKGGIVPRQRACHRAAPSGLPFMKEHFCLEYAKDFHGKRAAIAAGYAEKNAATMASKLLQEPDVRARLLQIKEKAFNKLEITHESILGRLAAIAFADPGDYMFQDPVTGKFYFDIDKTMRERPHKMAGLIGYEVTEMEPLAETDEEGKPAFREVLKTKIRLDPLKAIELLMKHRRMFDSLDDMTDDQVLGLMERMQAQLRQRRAMLAMRIQSESPDQADKLMKKLAANALDAEYREVPRAKALVPADGETVEEEE